MQPIRQLLLVAGLVGVLAACMPIQAPVTTSTPVPTVTAPAEEPAPTPDAIPVESVDAAQCDALAAALSAQLGHDLAKQEGTACTLVAMGTGEASVSIFDGAQTIHEVFEAEGWTEDEAAIADGPTGTATSYFKDTTVAAVSGSWEPSDEADCPANKVISACDIEPSQQDFTISVKLVQIA